MKKGLAVSRKSSGFCIIAILANHLVVNGILSPSILMNWIIIGSIGISMYYLYLDIALFIIDVKNDVLYKDGWLLYAFYHY